MIRVYLNKKNVLKTFVSLLLIFTFFRPAAAFPQASQTLDTTTKTLAPYLISKIIEEHENEVERSRKGSRQTGPKGWDFMHEWPKLYARGLVKKILERAQEKYPILSLDAIEEELVGQIESKFGNEVRADETEEIKALGRQATLNTLIKLGLNERLSLKKYIELRKKIEEKTEYLDGLRNGQVTPEGKIQIPIACFKRDRSVFMAVSAHEAAHWLQLPQNGYIKLVKGEKIRKGYKEIIPVAVGMIAKLEEGISLSEGRDVGAQCIYEWVSENLYNKTISNKMTQQTLEKELEEFYLNWIEISGLWTDDEHSPYTLEEANGWLTEKPWQIFNGVTIATFAHKYSEHTGDKNDMWRYLRAFMKTGGRKHNLISELSTAKAAMEIGESPGILEQGRGFLSFADEVGAVVAAVRHEFSKIRMKNALGSKKKPGYPAGFGEGIPGVDKSGIDPRELLNETVKQKIKNTKSIAKMEDINKIKRLSNKVAHHKLLRPGAPLNTKDTVILMRNNLIESISGRVNDLVNQQYVLMKQRLRKRFADREGLVEVDTNEALYLRAKYLLADEKKVIILDDASIEKSMVDRLAKETGKKNTKDFCVINAEKVAYQSPFLFHYVNLEAMALMGVGVLQDDYEGARLFELAYELFEGNKPPAGLFRQIKQGDIWTVIATPMAIRLTGQLIDNEIIRKIFAISA